MPIPERTNRQMKPSTYAVITAPPGAPAVLSSIVPAATRIPVAAIIATNV